MPIKSEWTHLEDETQIRDLITESVTKYVKNTFLLASLHSSLLIPLTAPYKAWGWSRSMAGFAGSNAAKGMDSLSCECYNDYLGSLL